LKLGGLLSEKRLSAADGIYRQMNRVGQVISTVLGLILVVAAMAGVAFLFILAVRQGATFWAATVAAGATVVGALLVRNFERRRVADSIRRERLADIYMEMAQVLHGRQLPKEERNESMADFLRHSLVYASAKTLKAFQSWTSGFPEDGATADAYRASSLRYEVFVRAMRDDLGISNRGLSEGDLIRLGIYDWDDSASA
jgi:hypothetical protein